MIGLAGLGVNIGPLMAGAGIAGIAIGFGTQTLVRDIVSGVFFLVDDSFRLGEYVDVGPVKGTVERISLRSMQIRHHRGALHTIPFGEVKRLTNHSREWVIHKVELPLPPETDLDVIRKMLKRIGEELVADPELGPHILQPLKSQGLMQVEDGALILRAKFMVRPDDQQFVIRREVLSRIKRALEEKGIRFAPRQVLVHVAQPSRAPDAPAPTPANGNPRAGRCGSRRRGGRPFPASCLRPRRGSRQAGILDQRAGRSRSCGRRVARTVAALRATRPTPLAIDSSTGVVDALLAGRASAYTSDDAQRTAARVRAPAGQPSSSFRSESRSVDLPADELGHPHAPGGRGNHDDAVRHGRPEFHRRSDPSGRAISAGR
jgi:mechanosensitive ion channel-like protein